MALPMLRGCSRVPSTFSFSRLFLSESLVLKRSGKTQLPSPSPAAVAAAVRPYSSDRGGQKQNQKVVVVGIPNPFIWFRTRIYYFLIRAYFDKEFNIEEFTEGAKQAFSHVSILLSQCQFDALEGLVAKDHKDKIFNVQIDAHTGFDDCNTFKKVGTGVTKDWESRGMLKKTPVWNIDKLIGKLEEKCNLLPLSHKKALSAESDEIMYTTPGDVGIYYDDNGRKFVSILMRFWYLTSARLPDDNMEGTRVFQVAIGGEGEAETKRLLTANYEFQREFTKGVAPDWTITRIEHSKLLD